MPYVCWKLLLIIAHSAGPTADFPVLAFLLNVLVRNTVQWKVFARILIEIDYGADITGNGIERGGKRKNELDGKH